MWCPTEQAILVGTYRYYTWVWPDLYSGVNFGGHSLETALDQGVGSLFALVLSCHPAESLWQLEQTRADSCHTIRKLHLESVLLSAYWLKLLKMLMKLCRGTQDQQNVLQGFSALCLPLSSWLRAWLSRGWQIHSCDLSRKWSCSRTVELVGMLHKDVTWVL